MLFNLLLVDPDNIPDGVGKASNLALYILAITIIAILVTIISACIITYLYKKSKTDDKKETGAITTLTICFSLAICFILILLCVFALMET